MAATEELKILLRTVADTSGAKQTEQALKGVHDTVKISGEDMLRFAGALTGAEFGLSLFATAGQRIREGLGDSIQVAREHERILRATTASYGSQTQAFTRFASALGEQTGFTSDAILEAALSARTLSQNYGLTTAQTQKLIQVSTDLARIRGIGVAESFERIQSAIRGEAEASEYLGLTLNDTYIANNALNGSLKNTFNTMTDQQKAQVRYNELLKQTADFSGLAAARTDSLDDALRRAGKSAHDVQLEVGTLASPLVIHGLEGVGVVLEAQQLRLQSLQRDWSNLASAIREVVDAGRRAIGQGEPSTTRISQQLQDIHDRAPTAAEAARAAAADDAARATARRQIVAQQDAARRAQELQNRRLLEENTTFVPRLDNAATLARLAFLDQVDAAVREIQGAQQRQNDLQRESVELAGREAQIRLGMLPAQQRMAELQRDVAEQQIRARQAALPSTESLEDLRYLQERNRLIAGSRELSADERREARRSLRGLARAEPEVALSALEAQRGVTLVERGATRAGMEAQLFQIGQDRQLAQIGLLTTANGYLQAIAAQRTQAIMLTVNVSGEDFSKEVYKELVEANQQSQTPPVVQISAVRRN